MSINMTNDELFLLGTAITGGKQIFDGESNSNKRMTNTVLDEQVEVETSTTNPMYDDEGELINKPVKVNFTDDQLNNLISGMITGLAYKNNEFNMKITMDRIYSDKDATIGLGIGDYIFGEDEQVTYIMLPVFVHHVNINWHGFTCRIKYDYNRCRVTELIPADFGTVSMYNADKPDILYSLQTNGEVYCQGRLHTTEFTEDKILFYMRIRMIDFALKNSPIDFKFVSSANYDDDNYTTLYSHEDQGFNEEFFVTPLNNIGGMILLEGEEEEPPASPITEGEKFQTKASPTGIFLNRVKTAPGEIGVMPVMTNSRLEENFPYNRFHVRIRVDTLGLMSFMGVHRMEGWSISSSVELIEGTSSYLINIYGLRGMAAIDSATPCYIQFAISDLAEEYEISFINEYSQLSNDDLTRNDIVHGNGVVFYSVGEYEPDNEFDCGSITGSGAVYSPSGGGIGFIEFNGAPPIPVWIPEEGELYFHIPIILPEDEASEAELVLKTNKYVLIKTGFKYSIYLSRLANNVVFSFMRSAGVTLRLLNNYNYEVIEREGDKVVSIGNKASLSSGYNNKLRTVETGHLSDELKASLSSGYINKLRDIETHLSKIEIKLRIKSGYNYSFEGGQAVEEVYITNGAVLNISKGYDKITIDVNDDKPMKSISRISTGFDSMVRTIETEQKSNENNAKISSGYGYKSRTIETKCLSAGAKARISNGYTFIKEGIQFEEFLYSLTGDGVNLNEDYDYKVKSIVTDDELDGNTSKMSTGYEYNTRNIITETIVAMSKASILNGYNYILEEVI